MRSNRYARFFWIKIHRPRHSGAVFQRLCIPTLRAAGGKPDGLELLRTPHTFHLLLHAHSIKLIKKNNLYFLNSIKVFMSGWCLLPDFHSLGSSHGAGLKQTSCQCLGKCTVLVARHCLLLIFYFFSNSSGSRPPLTVCLLQSGGSNKSSWRENARLQSAAHVNFLHAVIFFSNRHNCRTRRGFKCFNGNLVRALKTYFAESVRETEAEVSCSFLIPSLLPSLPPACLPAIKGSSGCWNAKNAALAKTMNASERLWQMCEPCPPAPDQASIFLSFTPIQKGRDWGASSLLQGRFLGFTRKSVPSAEPLMSARKKLCSHCSSLFKYKFPGLCLCASKSFFSFADGLISC